VFGSALPKAQPRITIRAFFMGTRDLRRRSSTVFLARSGAPELGAYPVPRLHSSDRGARDRFAPGLLARRSLPEPAYKTARASMNRPQLQSVLPIGWAARQQGAQPYQLGICSTPATLPLGLRCIWALIREGLRHTRRCRGAGEDRLQRDVDENNFLATGTSPRTTQQATILISAFLGPARRSPKGNPPRHRLLATPYG
jgi:hypothetical protein